LLTVPFDLDVLGAEGVGGDRGREVEHEHWAERWQGVEI
jgi:hypothetical protein